MMLPEYVYPTIARYSTISMDAIRAKAMEIQKRTEEIMRRISERRQALMDEVGPAREAFRLEFAACMACPLTNKEIERNPVLDVHEIARGVHRDEALRERQAWLLVCRECHEEMNDTHLWPLARQYALKLLCDPQFYDRVRLNELRDRAPEAITEDEVATYLGTLKRNRSWE